MIGTRVRISLKLFGEAVHLEIRAPPADARWGELLPLFWAIDDAAVDAAIRQAAKAGETVSCRTTAGAG